MIKVWFLLLVVMTAFAGCYGLGMGLTANAGNNTAITSTSYSVEMFNGNSVLSGNTDTLGLIIVALFLMFACCGLLVAVVNRFG